MKNLNIVITKVISNFVYILQELYNKKTIK